MATVDYMEMIDACDNCQTTFVVGEGGCEDWRTGKDYCYACLGDLHLTTCSCCGGVVPEGEVDQGYVCQECREERKP